MRDDFPVATKRILALRAGYRCSFTNCRKLTCGPSEENPLSFASIGVAANISAASPDGRRYLESMQASKMGFGCADHATLIDRDEALYTINALSQMKRRHEEWCAFEVRGASNVTTPSYSDLVVGMAAERLVGRLTRRLLSL
jgi:hypothetical protein